MRQAVSGVLVRALVLLLAPGEAHIFRLTARDGSALREAGIRSAGELTDSETR